MKKNLPILIFVSVVGIVAISLIIFILTNKKNKNIYPIKSRLVPITNTAYSTSTVKVTDQEWGTYTNFKYGFKIDYPSSWIVDEGHPEFISFFDKEHANFVSIFPFGKGTEGRFEPSVPSDVVFSVPTSVKLDYITSTGERYATYAKISYVGQNNWNQNGLVEAQVKIYNLKKTCKRGNAEIDINNCDVWRGDQIVFDGNIQARDREILKKIISSFKFIE